MANLIDKIYFIGELNIAQLSQQAVRDNLTVVINKREPEYLEKVLGYAFYQLYKAGIIAGEQIWKDIRDGAEYVNADGFTKKWTGFANAALQSPIANYVYYWYIRDNVSFAAGTGEKVGKSDNASNTVPNIKLFRAWNEMVRMNAVLHDFLLNKKDDDGNLVYEDFDIDQTECIKKMGLI